MKKKIILTLILFISNLHLFAINDSIIAISRYSFFSNELFGELIIKIPETNKSDQLFADILFENKTLSKGIIINSNKTNFVEFPLAELPFGESSLNLIVKDNTLTITGIKVKIIRLEPKLNEVKIDRATGGLIVNNAPFFPFGFYCYSPVQPTLAEEEVVKGFNMMSPYQNIQSRSLGERKAYMDRCAELGMKVHYNLLSVAGGGGVGFDQVKNKSDNKKRNLLISEIETFRDHPALLAWYISDEPTGHKISPEELEEDYRLIRELDPYHPVTIVFMAPKRAREYSNTMDIVMADPYPLPHGSVMEVNNVAKRLHKEFVHEKPVWMVPQAFGGSEWWLREPTAKEIRVMTYLSIINKATGIQYFVRHGLSSFPKSTETWSECGVIALEIAELTPHLLSIEMSPLVESHTMGVKVNAWKKDGVITVIAVNTLNKPLDFSAKFFDIEGSSFIGAANLIFENRKIPIANGEIKDMIDAHGTRVYQIDTNTKDDSLINSNNLVHDAGFENNPSVGTPAYCYAKNKGDRGATYFIDSRISFQGNHSLRLTTPKYNEGIKLSFYPLELKKGKSYKISIMAKAGIKPDLKVIVKKGFFKSLFRKNEKVDNKMYFDLALAEISSRKFQLTNEWKEYSFTVRLSSNGNNIIRGGPVLSLISQGTAWFDLLQVIQVD
ncbi:hypothetical protein ACFLSI_02860 [Bacteroidota bacterium]